MIRSCVVALVLTSGAFAACGQTMSTDSRSTPRASQESSDTPHGTGYGGLGARAAAFTKRNNTQAPHVRTPGIATYTINSITHGRVTAYSVEIPAVPPMGNRERMFLT